MADGKILPYLDIPFQHAESGRAQAHAASGGAGKDAGAHRAAGARSVPISPSARPSSSDFPARPSEEFAILLDWLDEAAARSRRLLPLRAGCRRGQQRARRSGAEGRHRGALAPLHAAPAENLRAPHQAQGRHPPAGHHRRGRPDRSPRAAARAMRRRSTARSMWRAAGRCASAKSPR